jgi:GntR family transcriptional regulator
MKRLKYQQIARILRNHIELGEWGPNEPLPTELTMCAQFAVSRGTVQQAVRQLVNEGLVRREQGRGTFVNEKRPSVTTLFSFNSFSDEMRRQGRQPATRVLSAETVPAPAEIAAQLGLPAGCPSHHITRLRLADSQPVALEQRWLAAALCPDLLAHDLAASSIHYLLVEQYEIPLVRLTHTVEMGELPVAAAHELLAEPGQPAFLVDRLTFTRDEANKIRPAVLYRAVFLGDNYDLGLSRYLPQSPQGEMK